MRRFCQRLILAGVWALLACLGATPRIARCSPPQSSYWKVDDLRPAMKGYGLSVFKGDRIERFDAEVLGVLKNVNPGRDMVLVRLSGCDLNKTGVIAGMSGSPIYIDEKLVGAVAYAWAFGTEPIAGVTPFAQMVEFVESSEQRDLVKKDKRDNARADDPPSWPSSPSSPRRRQPLAQVIEIEGRRFDAVSVTPSSEVPLPGQADELALRPLLCPLAASNFTAHSLSLLRERTRWAGLVPMQAGAAPAHVLKDQKEYTLAPGAPLAVALVRGDFDLSGIGTVTHIEGERVYGWGHPFMGLGACALPLMSGYVHTIYPRQTVSFKMGSPVRTLGVINADVSTGIAGWLGRQPDLLPVKMTVRRDPGTSSKTFQCEIARQKALVPQLVYTTLTNAVDMEGELPEELTAELEVRIELEGRPPLVLRDTYSGPSYSGGRAPAALYSQVASLVHSLTYNPFEPVRVQWIGCRTKLSPGRCSAEIEAVQLESETYSPGDTLHAAVFVKPYQGPRQQLRVRLKLPADLPPGVYTATICDDVTHRRAQIRESPVLSNPSHLDQLLEALEVQAAAQRMNLVVRVPLTATGVAFDGQALPDLPASMVEMLAKTRRTGAQTMQGALVSEQPTDWVLQGSESVKFAVVRNKRLSAGP